jgi:transcription-repair coupling factor (superfamily II helicase)
MKDLDIRGAGNLLGGEQSGFISDIGFEMYQKILNEAIDELRESEFKDLFADRNSDSLTQFVRDCVLETDLEIRIPDTYVNNVAERLSLYQDMDNLKNEEELKGFLKELADRFGPVPKQVDELAYSFKLRWLAQELGIERLILKSEKMIGYFVANPKSPYYESPIFTKVLDYVSKHPNGVKLSEKNDRLRIIYSNVKGLEDARNRLNAVLKV